MTKISDTIETFIKALLSETNKNSVEIQRNNLAQRFNCASSQINYVLSTRFTNERGYYIESRRGGGGYIKIVKVNINNNKNIQDVILNKIGNSITKDNAYRIIDNLMDQSVITHRECNLMKAILCDRALNIMPEYRNYLRASILKEMLLSLLRE